MELSKNKMAFLENIKQFATGKTESERKQSATANLIIRRKARAAAFREKEKQEIRLATAREKSYYDRKVQALNKPKQFMGSGSGLDYFREQPRVEQTQQQSKSVVKYVKIKKGKKKGTYKKLNVRHKIQQPTQQPQKRFDVIGRSSGGNGFRVI